ncbi:MAG TPA: hypothetical protein ENH38_09340 [Nitrospirae bacterium]|nr:hypothetical protein [Nitrospirota bacterium]HDZ88802.1 hypothetical protein [Nitrospirota bacterium]
MMDMVIRHDGKNWVVENDKLTLSAPTIDGIDEKVRTFMRQNELVKKGDKSKVRMLFDNSTIPQWIRQYGQHYFNRVIEVEG